MIDTHCHLDDEVFDADRAGLLERARALGITDLVVPGIGPRNWERVRALAASDPGLHAAYGIHPQLLAETDPAEDDRMLSDLEAALARGGAVAVGECGLDAPTAARGAGWERQASLLRAQLALARRFGLPVLVHVFHAHERLAAILAAEELPAGVLHSFSGSAEQVRQLLRFGLHFAFAGPVTYAQARKPVEAARAVPAELLLLETDAPDQTPRPRRGRCEPAHLADVAAAVARARGLSVAELDRLTSDNARRLFRLHGGAAAAP